MPFLSEEDIELAPLDMFREQANADDWLWGF